MKVAYVDHSYHKKTISTQFISEMLVDDENEVDFFWDDSWCGGDRVIFEDLLHYDCIIMFQSFCEITSADYYAKLHSNVIYIPMLDQFGVWRGPINCLTEFWRSFQGCKIINFSKAAHGIAIGAGLRSELFQYYKEKKPIMPLVNGLKAFFWLRLQDEISWETIKLLIGDTHFDSVHLHMATDPNSTAAVYPSQEDMQKYNITVSTWFDSKQDFENVLKMSNVFFVPRMEEGIGQSFLEALSYGQCVVAPNNGTMNEYIQDGLTGLLYDINRLVPLDFSNVENIRFNAYASCEAGFNAWEKSKKRLIGYIKMSNSEAYISRYNYFSIVNDLSPINKRRFSAVKLYLKRYALIIWLHKKIKQFSRSFM